MFILEIFTVGFLFFFPAIGAFLAFICGLLGASFNFQLIIFVLSSILLIIFIRPIVAKFFKTGDVVMNSNSVVGKKGIMVKPIKSIHSRGQVKIGGELWSAICENDEEIEEGATVVVQKIDGVKLVVKKV